MSDRYLRKEELRVIRESLLVNKRQIRIDANNEFTEKLDKYEKISDVLYDEAIGLLKIIDVLYKELDPNNTSLHVVVEENE